MASYARNDMDAVRALKSLNINSLDNDMNKTRVSRSTSEKHTFEHDGGEEKKRGLRIQKSMLDIIDDTTLTSLPLIPPLKANNNRFNNISLFQNKESDYQMSREEEWSINMLSEKEDSFTYDNDTFDEPIVLIEDYIEDANSQSSGESRLLERKQSLADFKQKCFNAMEGNLDENSIIPELEESIEYSCYTKRTASNESGSSRLIHQKPENLEDVLGKLPDTDLLKYCNLCEKPLYELSSLLNKNIKKTKILQNNESAFTKSTIDKKGIRELYNEFVCGECVELYEEFFDELYFNELRSKNEANDSKEDTERIDDEEKYKMKLISVFGKVQQKYNREMNADNNSSNSHGHIEKKPSFSEALLNNLRALSENKQGFLAKSSIDLSWLREFQYKMRWRWRINGLLPQISKLKA